MENNIEYTIKIDYVYEKETSHNDEHLSYGVIVFVGTLPALYFTDNDMYCGEITYGDIFDAGAWNLFFSNEPYDAEKYPREKMVLHLNRENFFDKFLAEIEDGIEEAKELLEQERERQKKTSFRLN